MKKLFLMFIILTAGIFILSSCSNDTSGNDVKEKNKEAAEDGSKEKDSAEAEEEEKKASKTVENVSSDLVSEENPVDERSLLENAMKKQKTLLKPGFVQKSEFDYNVEFRYADSEDFIQYTQSYELSDSALDFLVTADTESENMDEILEEAKVEKEFDHDKMKLKLTFSEHSSDVYELWGRYDHTNYTVFGSSDDTEYSDELIGEIGQSLKTEKEGAFDPIYSMFDLDLDTLQFPKTNGKDLDAYVLRLFVFEDYTSLEFSYIYDNDEDEIQFEIQTEPIHVLNGYDEEETVSIDGVNVTRYKGDFDDSLHYSWTDGTHYYKIVNYDQDDNGNFEEEDMYALIQSAINDDRTFSDKKAFEPVNNEPDLNKSDKELYEKLHKINEQ